MDILNKFKQLQNRKRQRPLSNELNETSVVANEQDNNDEIDVVGVDENIEPAEVERIDEPILIEFETGPTNKGGIALWHEGLLFGLILLCKIIFNRTQLCEKPWQQIFQMLDFEMPRDGHYQIKRKWMERNHKESAQPYSGTRTKTC